MARTRTSIVGKDTSSLEDTWRRFRAGELDCRNKLVEAYLPLVKVVAERMHARLVEQVDIDDLHSSGILGLLDAVNAYDPDRGVKFETYCLPRIRGAMLDELRSMDWVPRLVRSRHRKLMETVEILEATMGRKPTETEIARKLGVPLSKVRQMQNDSNLVGQISLEHPVDNGGGKLCRLGETIRDRNQEEPSHTATKHDLRNLIMQGLSKAERLVILLYYYEGMTMKEIGATLGLSESRISQMHSELVERLRAAMKSHGAPPTAAA